MLLVAATTLFLFYVHNKVKFDSKSGIGTFNWTKVSLSEQENANASEGNNVSPSEERQIKYNNSILPAPQEWIKRQFEHVLKLMGEEYRSERAWNTCHYPTYYFENIRTIYTGIPKTGCSNWLEALLLANGDLKRHIDRQKVDTIHFGILHRHTMQKIKKKYNNSFLQQEFSFTVVRNPWTRIVSGYRDKISSEKTMSPGFPELSKNIAKEMREIQNDKELDTLHATFPEFVNWLIKHNGSSDIHFYQQHRSLCIPKVRYDYILPFEYTGLLNQEVWSKISSNTLIHPPYDSTTNPRLQKSADLAREWFSQLDNSTIKKLYDIYRIDFALMNYSNFTDQDFPLPLYENKKIKN